MTPEFDKDRTFDPVSACGSDRWVAATLGSSVEWLRKHCGKLEAEGHPCQPADDRPLYPRGFGGREQRPQNQTRTFVKQA